MNYGSSRDEMGGFCSLLSPTPLHLGTFQVVLKAPKYILKPLLSSYYFLFFSLGLENRLEICKVDG